jgi:hypothetical protein
VAKVWVHQNKLISKILCHGKYGRVSSSEVGTNTFHFFHHCFSFTLPVLDFYGSAREWSSPPFHRFSFVCQYVENFQKMRLPKNFGEIAIHCLVGLLKDITKSYPRRLIMHRHLNSWLIFNVCKFISYHPIPWRDSISRPRYSSSLLSILGWHVRAVSISKKKFNAII